MLSVLVESAGQVVTKDTLIERVWSGTYASGDTITRTVSRLRAALGDKAKAPRYIETVPKRGYRLVAPVKTVQHDTRPELASSGAVGKRKLTVITLLCCLAAVVLLIWLLPQTEKDERGADRLQQADDFYHQMRLADNEMAMTLYQQHLALQPDSARAYAGLANAIVQRVMRWSGEDKAFISLTKSLEDGVLAEPAAQEAVRRAGAYAQRAMELEPENAAALKAKGFVLSAQGRFELAITFYEQALAVSPQAWSVLLNLGELASAQGDTESAREHYKSAFNAMMVAYTDNEVQIRPWISDVAELIGSLYLQQANYAQAEYWYRQALHYTPLHEDSTLGLARLAAAANDSEQALALCRNLNQKLKTSHECDGIVRVLSE
ncbi:winged helix-turn-helix domain-containing protein [Pseudidiomarina sp. 1ASP75-5]|nr:winged helix-turn-helix domain-containing protein [Pseudidiomarina sp. 1ASP75-5]